MADSTDPAVIQGLPAAKPPVGVVPNLVDPGSEGPILIAVGSVLVAIMLLFVAVRIYTKFTIVRRSSPDDCQLTFPPPD